MEIELAVYVVVIGVVLDSLIGDPYCMPHPIRVFGNTIAWCEGRLNSGVLRRLKGGIMWFALVGFTWSLFTIILHFLNPYPWVEMAFNSLFFYYGVSNRCLIDEGLRVEQKLNNDTLDACA